MLSNFHLVLEFLFHKERDFFYFLHIKILVNWKKEISQSDLIWGEENSVFGCRVERHIFTDWLQCLITQTE